jgi:transcription elongation factor GreA
MTQQQPNYVTAEGKEKLEQELHELKTVKRPEMARKLKEAVAEGDLKENADYHDAREQQSFLEGRILQLESLLRTAVVIEDTGGKTDEVRLGSEVTIVEEGTKDEETYIIVGAAEANPRLGKISQLSPIGAALLGRRKGEVVRVDTPNGKINFKVKKIR